MEENRIISEMKIKIRFILIISIGVIVFNFLTWLLYGNFKKPEVLTERAARLFNSLNINYPETYSHLDTIDILEGGVHIAHDHNQYYKFTLFSDLSKGQREKVISNFESYFIGGKQIIVRDIVKNINYDHSIERPGLAFGYVDNIPMYLICGFAVYAGEVSVDFIWKGIWLFFTWVTVQEYIAGGA